MKWGPFSITLASKTSTLPNNFMKPLDFTVLGGDLEKNYLIMKNGNALIGLFQGMFENNILTFNPGWDENANLVEPFDDVRTIQRHLKDNKIEIAHEADENTFGPASFD